MPDIPAHTTAICLTEVKESQQHTVVYTHTSINSHIVYAYTFQRALRSASYGGVVQTSAWSQHSSGGGSLVMCVRFLTCCTDTDRTSRVSPEERCRSTNTLTNTHTHTNKQTHKSPASVRSGIMRTMRVVFTQQRTVKVVCGRQENWFLFYYLATTSDEKKKNPTCILSQIFQCNHMKSNLALENYCGFAFFEVQRLNT